ncbi:MAG: SDR family oxidoreductase [Hyphomicrobiaceae bacterium]
MAETRIALVSGGSRGIGLEIVRQLARDGIMPVLGARDKSKGEVAAQSLKSEGFDVPTVALDVTSEKSIKAAVDEVMKMFGRIDILINNAAVLLDDRSEGTVENLSTEILTETFTTNVYGVVWLTQSVLPIMREQGYGRIVNLSSELAQLCNMTSGYAGYRMSKTAVNALTRITAGDLAGLNVDIKINSASPGWVRTELGGSEAKGTPEEGAETAVWLAQLPEDGPTGGFFEKQKALAW